MGGDCNDHRYFLLIAFDTNQIRYFFWTCEILKCVKYIARESRVDGYVNKLNNSARTMPRNKTKCLNKGKFIG